MKKEHGVSPVYQRDVLEFVTVAVQFCAYLEEAEQKQPREFVDTMLRLLPLLYLKGTLLPAFDMDEETELQDFVTEENYDIVRSNVAMLMGEHDDYLDVFMEDMKYSDTPILTTVSENLADIYQDLKNFALNYRQEVETVMQEALAEVKENFEHYWGQRCVNVMRALHDVRYNSSDDEAD
ncbi:MAG: DUF5063 domain-containing protein [Bacteroidaceae bacterium]|nr:DUF5063 domain-containing protein [Bacteroidaceae bacterium]